MPFDSNGVFSRVMNWTSDQQNGIAIECGRHDAEDDNFAQGFNDCFCRDGRTAATGDFNLGNYKIQNLANGTATTDAVNKGQLDTGLSAKATPAQVNTAINTMLSTLYPVGACYIGTQSSCPLAMLISGSTWTKIGTSVITSVNTSAPVAGNGNAIKIKNTDNSTTSANHPVAVNKITSGSSGAKLYISDINKDVCWADIGATATVTRTSLTVNIWQRTA